MLLPNYGVFDEDRYFAVGQDPERVWEVGGTRVGVSICEDIWLPDGPPRVQAASGAGPAPTSTPRRFTRARPESARQCSSKRACVAGAAVVYVNLVGGQDELVFDGCSLVVGPDGTILHRSPQFEEDMFVADVPLPEAVVGSVTDLLEPVEEVYRALETGLVTSGRTASSRW